jgi:hypothetical protein
MRTVLFVLLGSLSIDAFAADAPAIDTLKSQYVACERRAADALLGFGDAARCSSIYETLKQRAFDGDARRLFAWWQAELRSGRAGSRQTTE